MNTKKPTIEWEATCPYCQIHMAKHLDLHWHTTHANKKAKEADRISFIERCPNCSLLVNIHVDHLEGDPVFGTRERPKGRRTNE